MLTLALKLLLRYAIAGDEQDWASAEAQVAAKLNGQSTGLGVVSVKNPNSTKALKRKSAATEGEGGEAKSSKKNKKSKSGDKKSRQDKH